MDNLVLYEQRKQREMQILNNLLKLLPKESLHISDDVMKCFLSVYGDVLKKALKFIDEHSVYYFHTKHHQEIGLFMVGANPVHVVYPELFFCDCTRFVQCLKDNSPSFCEHLIARDIAWTLRGNSIDIVEVENDYLVNLEVDYLSKSIN